MNLHLTPDQLDEYLIDPAALSSDSRQHLAACPACRLQLTAFTQDLAAFNQATLAWAEAKSSTLPVVTRPVFRGTWLPLAWSSVALACGAIAFTAIHHTPSPHQEAALHTHPTSQLTSDNQLLANIDQAVEAPVVSPTNLFEDPGTSLGAR